MVVSQQGKCPVVGSASPSVHGRLHSRAIPCRGFSMSERYGSPSGLPVPVAGLAHLFRSGTSVQVGVRVQSNHRRPRMSDANNKLYAKFTELESKCHELEGLATALDLAVWHFVQIPCHDPEIKKVREAIYALSSGMARVIEGDAA